MAVSIALKDILRQTGHEIHNVSEKKGIVAAGDLICRECQVGLICPLMGTLESHLCLHFCGHPSLNGTPQSNETGFRAFMLGSKFTGLIVQFRAHGCRQFISCVAIMVLAEMCPCGFLYHCVSYPDLLLVQFGSSQFMHLISLTVHKWQQLVTISLTH